MQGDGQHQQRGAFPRGGNAFRSGRARMQMGQQGVHRHQEKDSQQESARSGQPARHAGSLRLVNGRDKQAPYGGGDHHPGGKPQKNALHVSADFIFEEENQGGAQGGHQEGEAGSSGGPEYGLRSHKNHLKESFNQLVSSNMVQENPGFVK